MSTNKLAQIFDILLKEVRSNAQLSAQVEQILESQTPDEPSRKRGRRAAAILDPIKVYEDVGAEGLQAALAALSVPQLKDIVAEYGMDQMKLVLKWTSSARIAQHILNTSASRARKGNAFR